MARLHTLGVTGGRLVATWDPSFFSYGKKMDAAHLHVAAVLTSSSFSTADYFTEAATYAHQAPFVGVWLVGNEWNIEGDASWPSGDDKAFISIWNRAAYGIKSAAPSTKVYVGGLFSEPDMLGHMARVWSHLDPVPDGIDWHPYLNTTSEIATLIEASRDVFGCEQGIFEWNWASPKDIPAFESFLESITEHSCWFCWSDSQVPNYGLVDSAGHAKKTYTAYRKALRSSL